MRINRHMHQIAHYAEGQIFKRVAELMEWVKLSESAVIFRRLR